MRTGFRNRRDYERTIAGVRKAETLSKTEDVRPPGFHVPSGNINPVIVTVTGPIITSSAIIDSGDNLIPSHSEYHFYPGVFVHRDVSSETPSDDWVTTQYICLVVPLNDDGVEPEVLVEGKRYLGFITGERNGKPVVVVIALDLGAILSGSGSGGGDGQLNTISFGVVTDVTCSSSGAGVGGLVVTKKVVYITGHDLSVIVKDD